MWKRHSLAELLALLAVSTPWAAFVPCVAVKPMRVVWRRTDCGAAIARTPTGQVGPRPVSLPAYVVTSTRDERTADRHRSALARKRWRRSGMRGDRSHDERLRSVSSCG